MSLPPGACLELAKPRITVMVVSTAAIGYFLAGGAWDGRLAWTALGIALASCAGGALNQWMESGRDALMRRTQARPIPSGRMEPAAAMAFGLSCAATGLPLLVWKAGWLSGALAFSALTIYILIYTPLKPRTPQSTWFGAISGALPPLIGWAAVRGELAPLAWVLFSVQLLWQIPHFLALFWLYRDEYARAGFKVMPVLDPSGWVTALQIALHCFALLLASLSPLFFGWVGPSYGWTALVLGTLFLGCGLRLSWTLESPDARRLFFASLAYLPMLLGALAWAGA